MDGRFYLLGCLTGVLVASVAWAGWWVILR